ncbi:unnamed protein product [Candida verbasci]|uniref:DUF1682-domain-containing protein n=1 Tax=Candida verbasci TaxID=1227364 RepID=A0A9W4XGN7_9ASCO|nr:unnamed protein product [Candida verbasci]
MIFEALTKLFPIAVPETGSLTLEEVNNMTILQRLKLRDWRLEIFTLGFIILFSLFFKIGDIYNQSKVTSFLNGIKPSLSRQFFQYGVSKDKLYIKDSSENYSSYATGRLNIFNVNIKFQLAPRQNVFVWILETIFSFFTTSVLPPSDKVEIIIHPSGKYDNFISAIVSKIGMNDARKFNYFLSLCKTSDSKNLPNSFVYMSESNEIQEKLTTEELKRNLSVESANFIKYIAFTDQPIDHPESIREMKPIRKVIIQLELTTKKKDLETLNNVLDTIFSIIDKLSDGVINFKPETLKKIVKTRDLEVEKLQKIEQDLKNERLAEEQAKLKRQEREQLRNMSSEEQLKAEKKAAERRQKKMQKKQRIKM